MSAGGDVRSFYAALGIELPGWAQRNATVRCFANPQAHAHEDRTPSCSVSLEHGAFKCFACGAHGGAYDAALARGHTPASAIELLIAHGLAEPRSPADAPARTAAPVHRRPASEPADLQRPLACDEADVARWHQALFSDGREPCLARMCRQWLWKPEVMRSLGLGYDRGRLTIPIRNQNGRLRGVLRYQPGAAQRKMLAVRGTRLGLIPHPAHETAERVLLVEGPPDMLAARARGWPAIAVPGGHAWRTEWAKLLAGSAVTVLMDADAPGRAAAQRIATDLSRVCQVRVVDLAPERHDGFDLTDWLHHHQPQRRPRCTPSSSPKPAITH